MIVSSLIVQRDYHASQPIASYIERFSLLCEELEKISIPVTLFQDRQISLQWNFSNLEVIPISIEDLCSWQLLKKATKIMVSDNPKKNTLDYHAIMNAKIELCNRVAYANPNLQRISWMDCGITHVMKNPRSTIRKLSGLDKLSKGITIPGTGHVKSDDFVHPNWRFSGGFFSGDLESLDNMWRLSRTALSQVMPVATWEVNIWAYMESKLGWKPNWYYGNHNDSILDFPIV